MNAEPTPWSYPTPLYILPFDHRASFARGMYGWTGTMTTAQERRISATKRVIYDGFASAVAAGVPKGSAGVLVDEQFGADLLREARNAGYLTCVPVEQSGQAEFDFEFGESFSQHIETFAPTFAKALVRYNPEGDPALNRRQAERLRRLSEYLRGSPSKFMFELLVPPTPGQLHARSNDGARYDREVRPSLMVRAIRELQDAGIEPDVWKLEGLERREDYLAVAEAARRNGRDEVGCILLGRGEDAQHVHGWLVLAATVRGFIGFAVGRTTFWGPLLDWRDQKIPRAAAVAEIARRYRGWVEGFEAAHQG